MSTIIEETLHKGPEMINAVGQVVEFDGQAIYIGPGQRLSVLNDGVGVGLASSNDDVDEISGSTGNTEGYSRS